MFNELFIKIKNASEYKSYIQQLPAKIFPCFDKPK